MWHHTISSSILFSLERKLAATTTSVSAMPGATYGTSDPVILYWMEQSPSVLEKAKKDCAESGCKDQKAGMRSNIQQQWELQTEAVKQSWQRATQDRAAPFPPGADGKRQCRLGSMVRESVPTSQSSQGEGQSEEEAHHSSAVAVSDTISGWSKNPVIATIMSETPQAASSTTMPQPANFPPPPPVAAASSQAALPPALPLPTASKTLSAHGPQAATSAAQPMPLTSSQPQAFVPITPGATAGSPPWRAQQAESPPASTFQATVTIPSQLSSTGAPTCAA